MSHPILGPDAVEWLGTWYKVLLSSKDSGGGLSVTDSVGPAESGPPRHIHHDADETFVMLSGECEFWLEGRAFTAGPERASSFRAARSTLSASSGRSPRGI
ncbi:hypothetical protein ACFSZS_25460 [Seohaeicola zhoushanensis]